MKYEQKRKQFKEQEAALHKQISEIQKEKVVLEEKVFNIDTQREELKVKYETELVQLRD